MCVPGLIAGPVGGLIRPGSRAGAAGRASYPCGTMPYMYPATGLTRRVLEQRGFRGFVRFDELAARGVPGEAGVYAVVRPAKAHPAFAPRSTAGHHKRRGDPSVTVDELLAAWVDGASVVYIGKASAGKDGRMGSAQAAR